MEPVVLKYKFGIDWYPLHDYLAIGVEFGNGALTLALLFFKVEIGMLFDEEATWRDTE